MVAQRYDVVIAGGGPAGTATGITLAQRGYRVALFERERFPRFHVGESLLPGLWELWASLGVTTSLESMGFPVKQGVNFALPNVPHDLAFRTDEFPEYFPRPYTFHVDRARFDQVLLDHTRHVGVEVFEGWSVEEVQFDGTRAAGFTVRDVDGASHEVQASAVVDATGRNCLMARRLAWRKPDPALNKLSYFTHYRGAHRPLNEHGNVMTDIHCIPGGWIWYIPLAADVVSVGAVLDAEHVRVSGIKGVEQRFAKAIASSDRIAGWVEGSEQIEPVHAISNISYLNDSFVGDGFVLVGDASCFVDPIFSAGVTLAMRAGIFAAEALDDGLKRGDVSADALRVYEQRIRRPMERIFALIYSWYDILKRADGNNIFVRSQRIPILREKLIVLLSGGYDKADLESFLADSSEGGVRPH
jgi:halogenation protein CepH